MSYGGPAFQWELPDLCGPQFDGCILPVLRDDCCECASSTNELTTSTWSQFNVVNDGTNWNVPQRKAISRHDVGSLTSYDLVARPKCQRRQDVAQDTILVLDQSDVRCSFRRILNAKHCRRNVLPPALEVYETEPLHCTTLSVPGADPAEVISTGVPYPSGRKLLDDSTSESFLRSRLQELF